MSTPREVRFWFDPICPWCWVTARWLVDAVRPHRDLHVSWQPISLFFKNDPDPASDYYAPSWFTHRLLRVVEAVRDAHGDEPIERLYWQYGSRIHHDRDRDFDPADALEAAGLDRGFAAAFDDESWDAIIRKRMDVGLELAGNDIGTPIISVANSSGEPKAYFGPVITRVPPTEQSLAMWDSLVTMMDVEGFWELKRTRTERPDPGERP
jgi:hypothetical protein